MPISSLSVDSERWMKAYEKIKKIVDCSQALDHFCAKIEGAKTPNQMKTVLATAGAAGMGKRLQSRISCQPTSVARRKTDSKGRAPLLRGKVVKRRKHNLALSVRNNEPHAKKR